MCVTQLRRVQAAVSLVLLTFLCHLPTAALLTGWGGAPVKERQVMTRLEEQMAMM